MKGGEAENERTKRKKGSKNLSEPISYAGKCLTSRSCGLRFYLVILYFVGVMKNKLPSNKETYISNPEIL